MLCGSVLFSILNIAIIREFSLKTKDIRYFHTWLDGVLCLLLMVLTTILFSENYGNTRIDSAELAVGIMVGMGGTLPSSQVAWSYWLVDMYTIAAVPLFAAYVSHVEVELDIGDSSGYMDSAIANYFSPEDLQLLSIFDKTHSKTTAFGLYELHVLLILRFREMANMDDLVRNVNEEFSIAVSNGLVPNMESRRARAASLDIGREVNPFHSHEEEERMCGDSQPLLGCVL
jgi:hypothetical protein